MRTIKTILVIFMLVVLATSIATAALPTKSTTKTVEKLGSTSSLNKSNVTAGNVTKMPTKAIAKLGTNASVNKSVNTTNTGLPTKISAKTTAKPKANASVNKSSNTVNAKLPTKFYLGGYVFEDKNGNGRMDKNETGLANWTVNLEQPAGHVIGNSTTDAKGYLWFDYLKPGEYVVSEVLQRGWSPTVPANGTHVYNHTENNTLFFGNKIMPSPIRSATTLK